MMTRQEKLSDFFRQYALVSLGPEPEKLADFYDTSFLAAGPRGGAAFKNDESFLAWLREVHTFNVRSGMTSMTVGTVAETPVSAEYSLVTVEWATTFSRRAIPRFGSVFRTSFASPGTAGRSLRTSRTTTRRTRCAVTGSYEGDRAFVTIARYHLRVVG
jgi:hypothetical protein